MDVRRLCSVKLSDRKANAELLSRLGIENVSDVDRHSRLRWFGHVERKEHDDWISACRSMVVESAKAEAVAGQGRRGDSVLMKTWQS